MSVSTISLYATPPNTICSSPHPPYDFNLIPPSSSPSLTSSSQRHPPTSGSLTCLLRHHSPSSSTFYGETDDRTASFRCSSSPFGSGSPSPVSVLSVPGREKDGVVFNGLDCDVGGCLMADDVDVEELTFDMEDSYGVSSSSSSSSCNGGVEDILASARKRHVIFYDDFVVKAFYEAEKAHRGQVRASGHPYLQHCVETAVLLASIGANSTVVAAGLLHDTIDDSFVTYDYIFSIFGSSVADLVHGVSKLSHLSKLARDNNTADKTIEADRLHTMFLAMVDARAVLIKLADRLHNMMTLEALPEHKQQRFAKETLEIFAPLANRLGVFTWKEQLENLCFKHLYPIQHDELSSELIKSSDEVMITSAIEKLEQALTDQDIVYHDLSGRHKSLYSIYCKMLKKKLTMEQVHDIHGLRLIVENEDDCFRALKVVHQLWPEVPGKFKDYIHCPKYNGYQSLHTVVVGEGMVPLEVQIRTKEMHLQAEFGFAAHWRYKENDCKHSSFVLQMVEWARWVVTWHCEAMKKKSSSIGFVDSIKPECKFPTHSQNCPYSYLPQNNDDGPVFVIVIDNDKMLVQELPANCTMMDVLEKTGHGSPRFGFALKEELRPRLNHEPVSDPTCKLKMGDVIELTPAIPDKSLVEYREEIQRMYNRGPPVPVSTPSISVATATTRTVGWNS